MMICVWCVLIFLMIKASVDASILKEFDLVFSRDIMAPDGISSSVIVVNNIFPGPTLRVTVGDQLRINVTNLLSPGELLSVHGHGSSKRSTPWNDGTVGVTNCGIEYARRHVYYFTVEESGTFWYHLHDKLERGEGGYGLLIVDEVIPIATYDEERLFVIADWFHLNSASFPSLDIAVSQRFDCLLSTN